MPSYFLMIRPIDIRPVSRNIDLLLCTKLVFCYLTNDRNVSQPVFRSS